MVSEYDMVTVLAILALVVTAGDTLMRIVYGAWLAFALGHIALDL